MQYNVLRDTVGSYPIAYFIEIITLKANRQIESSLQGNRRVQVLSIDYTHELSILTGHSGVGKVVLYMGSVCVCVPVQLIHPASTPWSTGGQRTDLTLRFIYFY